MNTEDTIQAHFSSQDVALGDISIPVEGVENGDDWVLVRPQADGLNGYVLTVKVKVMERAPSDWFSVGIGALSHLPWYLKAEDLYALTKHVLQQYKISTSYPVTELCHLIDNASVVIATNVLSVRVEEGFSIIREIDELLEKVFASSDEKVDSGLVQLARSLQRLRRSVTRKVEGLSDATHTQMTALKVKASKVGHEAQEKYQTTVHSAYDWAMERTENTSQWVRTEKDEIVERISGLTVRGQAVVSDATARITAGPKDIVTKVTDGVNSRLAEATESLKGLPEKAHPYVVGAVEASQPYINSAVETATPYVQSMREKTAPVTAPVEEWLHDTKEVVEKKYPVVATATEKATLVLDQVVGYCTDEKYFSKQQEESVGAGENEQPEQQEEVLQEQVVSDDVDVQQEQAGAQVTPAEPLLA